MVYVETWQRRKFDLNMFICCRRIIFETLSPANPHVYKKEMIFYHQFALTITSARIDGAFFHLPPEQKAEITLPNFAHTP